MIQGSLVLTVIDFFKLSIEPAFFLEWKADADKLDMDMPANVYAYKHNTTLTHVPHKIYNKASQSTAKFHFPGKKKSYLTFCILVSNTFVIYSLEGKFVWNIN